MSHVFNGVMYHKQTNEQTKNTRFIHQNQLNPSIRPLSLSLSYLDILMMMMVIDAISMICHHFSGHIDFCFGI